MGVKIQIFCSDPQRIYLPGAAVSGTVVIDVGSPRKVTKISVQLLGHASTTFLCGINTNNTFSAKEDYVKDERMLWKAPSGDSDSLSGSLTYPFSFKLPSKCPPSFVSQTGKIAYTIQVHVDIPWAIDSRATENLTVISPPIDLNLVPLLDIPVSEAREIQNLKVEVSNVLI